MTVMHEVRASVEVEVDCGLQWGMISWRQLLCSDLWRHRTSPPREWCAFLKWLDRMDWSRDQQPKAPFGAESELAVSNIIMLTTPNAIWWLRWQSPCQAMGVVDYSSNKWQFDSLVLQRKYFVVTSVIRPRRRRKMRPKWNEIVWELRETTRKLRIFVE